MIVTVKSAVKLGKKSDAKSAVWVQFLAPPTHVGFKMQLYPRSHLVMNCSPDFASWPLNDTDTITSDHDAARSTDVPETLPSIDDDDDPSTPEDYTRYTPDPSHHGESCVPLYSLTFWHDLPDSFPLQDQAQGRQIWEM